MKGEVVFLHRLERGRASKSYGIEVARLAGLPPAVLTNAREVLARLERYELDVFADENGSKGALEKAGRRKAAPRSPSSISPIKKSLKKFVQRRIR